MANCGLLLLDPSGQLRAASATLSALSLRAHVRADTFLDDLRRLDEPSACVVDATTLGDAEAKAVRATEGPALVLSLAVVSTPAEGEEWLAAGAVDFTVLPERTSELEARVRGLLSLRQKLLDPRRAEHQQRAYLRGLAHEIKNPLNAIFGYAELLLMDTELSEQARLDVGRILRNAAAIQHSLEVSTEGREP